MVRCVPAELLHPLPDRVLSLPEGRLLNVSAPIEFPWQAGQACFEGVRCDGCGDAGFASAVTGKDGKTL